MDGGVPILLGGLGLFLLGMVSMTEGLRTLAGDRLHRILFRFTRDPVSGAATGALVTAVVQSSSATTVAAVGFVHAGLMEFSQALGILLGASVGTTTTGWMVALLGFELQLGTLLLPGILPGMMLHLFGRGRVRCAGRAVAGLATLFFGLGQMQLGMEPYADVVTPDSLPAATWGGRGLLVLIGIGVTLVTQSSSAGVATALTALHAGALSFEQAAAMVVGMSVGTTSTTALATLGGSPATRRTGLAHVIYSLVIGAGALLLLDPYAWLLGEVGGGDVTLRRPELALVGFHTSFSLLGLLMVLPVARRFARWMTRLVPDAVEVPERLLDRSLQRDPHTAGLALVQAVRLLYRATVAVLRAVLHGRSVENERLRLVESLRAVREWTAGMRQEDSADTRRRLRCVGHCLDHLERLLHRCSQRDRLAVLHDQPELARRAGALQSLLTTGPRVAEPEPARGPDPAAFEALHAKLRKAHDNYREQTLEAGASAGDLAASIHHTDAYRWLVRVSYHLWRIEWHFSQLPGTNGR